MAEQDYIAKKGAKAVDDFRSALAGLQLDFNKLIDLDWESIPEDKLMKLLPIIDALTTATTSLAFVKIYAAMIEGMARNA